MVWPAIIAGAATLGGIGLQSALGSGSAKTQFRYGMEAQRDAQNFSSSQYANRYQITTDDMYKAGLNPILAASGGFNVGGQPIGHGFTPSMYQPQSVDFSASARNITQAIKTHKTIDPEVQKIRTEIAINLKKENEILAKTAKLRAEKGLIKAEETLALKRVAEVQKNILRMSQEIEESQNRINMLKEKINLTQHESKLLKQREKEHYQLTNRIRQEYTNLKNSGQKLIQLGDVYSGTFGKILTYVQEILKTIPLIGILLPSGKGGKK